MISASHGEMGDNHSSSSTQNAHAGYQGFPDEDDAQYEWDEECERHQGADCQNGTYKTGLHYEDWDTFNRQQQFLSTGNMSSNSTTVDFDTSSSPVTTASTSQEDFAWVSDTLHQHAYAKQRRSRHDPGGGASQSGELVTPEVSTYPPSALQYTC